ncbi:Protein of unknown function (DUF1631) [Spongiibacter sp. IMCC21906]|uniref:DUF1631 family protein n=1 Tax=Spongiibacter sp. IMCC21906 TaxID=1620392 RepID=UPI00062DDE18|nr:DUF1631 family protein [Spongiibacter sp. IMCC21906]AKH70805.1 Protein of unknown function (DUF1631) [Spongiibacter sp. IMCC21906]
MEQVDLNNTLHLIIREWFEQAIHRYVTRLGDNFQRRARSLPSDQAQSLLDQYQQIEKCYALGIDAFRQHIEEQLTSPRDYQHGTHPQLDRLAKQLSAQSQPNNICRVASPMTVFSGFRPLSNELGIAREHYSQAVSLFNILVLNELGKLYERLLEELAAVTNSDHTQQWISHIKAQLASEELNANQRALAERRLSKLMGTPASPTELTEQQLIDEANTVFQDIPCLSSSIALDRSLQKFRTLLHAIALQEQRHFLSPLHPARRLCRQLTATLKQWDTASQESQQEFEEQFSAISTELTQQQAQKQPLAPLWRRLEDNCLRFDRRAQFNQRGYLLEAKNNARIEKLRAEIHYLINLKTADLSLPDDIQTMLLGPWASVVLYHWLRHGKHSPASQRSLAFIDDVTWYITPHTNWTDLRRAKAMAEQIEEELLLGMRRINTPPDQAKKILAELHRRRLNALALGSQSIQKNLPAS